MTSARGDLAGSATVQIVEADPQNRAAQARAAAAALRADAAVEAVRIVPEAELAALLEPWLGDGASAEAVPVPALIDVALGDAADAETIARLERVLADVAPDSRIDAQSDWLAPVLSALSTLRWMAFGLIALLAFTGAAAVWLAARNALGANGDTIEVVHLLGGNDDQIARIFQRSILLDALAGGALGLIAGIGAVLLMGAQFGALESGMVAGAGLSGADWIALALVPVAAMGIAIYTARFTVLSSLRKML